jgi:membrane protein
MHFFLLAVAFLAATPLLSKVIATPQGSAAQYAGRRLGARSGEMQRKSGFSKVKDILLQAYHGLSEHGTSLLAAGVAFYALFALFPALGAATWVFGLLADPATIHSQFSSLKDVLPAEAWQLIDQQLTVLTQQSASFSRAGIFNLLVAIYSARLAASSMMEALNTVYGVRERRGFLKTNAIAILFTLVGIAILLLAVSLLVVMPVAFGYVGLNSAPALVVHYARWPALAIVMALALAFTYRYGPDRDRARWKWLTWGSATATIIWLIASSGFSWYVSAFGSYDKVYGSIGAVVVLLFWFWLTTFSGLLGAELDHAIERQRGEPAASENSPKAV